MTINELIAALEEKKNEIGGEALVNIETSSDTCIITGSHVGNFQGAKEFALEAKAQENANEPYRRLAHVLMASA